MNRILFLLLLITLIIAGCGSKTEAELPAVVEPTAAALTTIPTTAQPTETATTVPVHDTQAAAPHTPDPVPPTDTPPATEIPVTTAPVVAAAKPQFLEFYTEW